MKLSFSFFKNLPEKERKITLSTKITIARILLVPFIVISMLNHNWYLAFWLILIAAISDTLDGALARMRNEKTILGSCLDPLADKIFIIACYFVFGLGHCPIFVIPIWFTYLVLIKELLLIIGWVLLYMAKGWIEIKPTVLGKVTMEMHSFFILWLFVSYFFQWHSIIMFNFLIYTILILVLSSLLQYVKLGIKQISFQGQI